MTRGIIWLLAALGMACVQCGGQSPDSGDSAGGTGAGSADAGCDDAAAGEKPLLPYARLHAACSTDVSVNRRGSDGGIISEHIFPSP